MTSPERPALPPLPSHPRVVESVLDLVGDTPLYEIRRLEIDPPRGRVFAKAEHQNPGGSVKDRICLAMIEGAEVRGTLKPGGVVVEPTSGNTGIGLALVCAAKGYRCVLTMPASMSLERRQLLEAYGAEVVLTDPELHLGWGNLESPSVVERDDGYYLFLTRTTPAPMDYGRTMVFFSRDDLTSSSAALAFSRPACTNTRATPESAD